MSTIYMPTMSRLENMPVVIPRWLEQDIPIRLVVEPDQYDDYAALRDEQGWPIRILRSPKRRGGVGYLRNLIVRHAHNLGYLSIIMADDDMYPKPGSDMRQLLEVAEDPRVLGIGAVRSIHDRFTSGAMTRASGPVICPGGWGNQVFGLNITNALALGNYNPKYRTLLDDNDMNLRGIVAGIPWLVHTDVWSVGYGKDKAPGGSTAQTPDRQASDDEARDMFQEVWPKYVSRFGNKHRVAWSRILTDYIPDWKERSAIHDGPLNWDGSPRNGRKAANTRQR